ncbi:substrate-binding periplasmic protein [Colwellia sp. MT41]|uniref:substrate-binding periplasmic protein n=1 Tax=Colwellia sp. MT41 TaxID=58049 RepID=UPI0018DE57F1|nr:transporter substrate-binding domain-containing protein [Colwellia sp. MT41]
MKSITLCLLLLSSSGFTEPVQIDLRHRPPEMSIVDNKYYGPLIDIIKLLLLDANLEPQWLVIPWPRTLLRAKLGQVDIIPRHSMTAERERYLLPMLLGYEQRSIHYLLAPTIKNIARYHSPKQFGHLIFGLLRGSYYGPYIDKFNTKVSTKVSTIYAHDINQLMSLLLTGRIDVMPIQKLSWAEAAYQQVRHLHTGLHYQIAEFKESFVSAKYISIPKDSPLAARFHQLNCKLFKLRNAGTIDSIYQEYGITPYLQIFENKESQQQLSSCLKPHAEQQATP